MNCLTVFGHHHFIENTHTPSRFARRTCWRPPEFRRWAWGKHSMIWVANLLVALVAGLHVYFLILEMFFWTSRSA
jgi:hypothetical protein